MIVPDFIPTANKEIKPVRQISSGLEIASPSNRYWVLTNLRNHIMTTPDPDEAREFITETCEGFWSCVQHGANNIYAFEKQKDAMHFKLRFF